MTAFHRNAVSALCAGLLPAGLALAQHEGHARFGPEKTILPAQPVVIPISAETGNPVVEVMLGENGPFKFVLDTGAQGGGRIDRKLARRLGLKKIGEVEASDGTGRNTKTVDVMRLDSIRIGDAEFEGVRVISNDFTHALSHGEDEIDGIVGFNLFAECLLTLDYPGRQLRIEKGELPDADGTNVLDFEASNGIPSLRVELGGQTIEAHIDSGSMGRFMLPKSLADKLPLQGKPRATGSARTMFNSFTVYEATCREPLKIGRHEFTRPVVSFSEIFKHANLGYDVLRHFSLTFDQRNHRVRLDRAEAGAIATAPQYRAGLILEPGDEKMTVREVVAGSAAEKAGVRAGDRLVSVNGRAAETFTPMELRKTMTAPKPVRLVLKRGGESVPVELTPSAFGS